jgi:hypothetical protein
MNVVVQVRDGVYEVDLEAEEVVGFDGGERLPSGAGPPTGLPRVVASAASGSTVVAVVDRRPPLVVSHDAGRTWTEAGGGLPPGRGLAISADDPDVVVYAARNRLYVSTDGGRFWRGLGVELPEIEAIALTGA